MIIELSIKHNRVEVILGAGKYQLPVFLAQTKPAASCKQILRPFFLASTTQDSNSRINADPVESALFI